MRGAIVPLARVVTLVGHHDSFAGTLEPAKVAQVQGVSVKEVVEPDQKRRDAASARRGRDVLWHERLAEVEVNDVEIMQGAPEQAPPAEFKQEPAFTVLAQDLIRLVADP